MNLFIFVLFFAHSGPVLLVGQILCGLTWGKTGLLEQHDESADRIKVSLQLLVLPTHQKYAHLHCVDI